VPFFLPLFLVVSITDAECSSSADYEDSELAMSLMLPPFCFGVLFLFGIPRFKSNYKFKLPDFNKNKIKCQEYLQIKSQSKILSKIKIGLLH
jgi:hypothetical protein